MPLYRSARMGATRDVLIVSVHGQGNSRSLFSLSLCRDDRDFKLLAHHSLGIGTSLYTPLIDVDLNLVCCVARGKRSYFHIASTFYA